MNLNSRRIASPHHNAVLDHRFSSIVRWRTWLGCLVLAVLWGGGTTLRAQDSTARSPWQWSGYLEAYYLYDVGQPDDHTRPDFVYAFNRHNEVNLNIGYLKAAYQTDRVRANLALMTGTYANANLAAEPGVLKNLYEASVGVRLSRQHALWVDAGIFPSHIGFESAVGAVCWTLTRSLLADNSPYFESGAKLSYTSADGAWLVSGLVLNGWQRIQRLAGNQTPAFGHQVTFTPSERITLNSSSFVGSDTPDSVRQMRYFHDFYGQFQLTRRWGLIVGFDLGAQQQAKGSRRYHTWYAPVLIARWQAGEKLHVAARGEYYADPHQVIVPTDTPHGFRTCGYSANLDYRLTEQVLWRLEGRRLTSKDRIFTDHGTPARANFALSTSLSATF
ncbi:Putative beta-barrel porin-2, OmpL-like. bbp2 [Catalinimonas alkaloidigena]|uniref:Putative beta-barrel porin-2, OmpL-like. bbp2 n=1 Tax=Catalinimonas alkaloidigena TaxID=1075417 RepID=A0A1G8YAT8_9BACT|nr:porin [Catalinimonas alkaloidigena]SDJ99962.1 Putative beta-barrel porin-2, OmpL-like. bbp2 [Catalinimonas alkaloidigena]